MHTNTIRTIFAIFLIAHGTMTKSLSAVPVPAPGALHTAYFPAWWRNNVDSRWNLWMAALVLFAAAGAGLPGIPGFRATWQMMELVAAIISLILLALYWHPWLFIGVLLNLGILVYVIAGWFTRRFSTQ